MKYKKGELITIETGEYSDYCVNGLFRVEKDFDAKEQLLIWADKYELKPSSECFNVVDIAFSSQYDFERDDKTDVDHSHFIGFLAQQGLISDVEYRPLFIGAYGEVGVDLREE